MGYTQPTAKTAGDPTLASDWNNYVKDNFIALRALLPDPGASNLPLVSTSTSVAAFGQLGTAGIATGAITADRIAAGAVGAAALAATSVGSAAIATGAVVRTRLAAVEQTPYGAVQMYAGASAPTGWLLCQGQSVSQSTYAALFDVVGTTYGTGSGAGQFALPNLQAKFPIGVEAASGSVYTRGATGGATSHTHGLNNHTHGLNGHTHTYSSEAGKILIGDPTTTVNSGGTTSPKAGGQYHGHDISWTGMTTDGSSATSAGNSGNTASTTDLPPYVAVNYIIYAGV